MSEYSNEERKEKGGYTHHKGLSRLSPLDIEVMKRLGSRVNLIPVIAKADTLTPADLAKFKQNVSIEPFVMVSPEWGIHTL